jgi:fructose-1,6-bisphosphatase I
MGPVKFPTVPKTIYSCNEGNYQLWDEKIQAAVEGFKNPPKEAGGKPYRWGGDMHGDM